MQENMMHDETYTHQYTVSDKAGDLKTSLFLSYDYCILYVLQSLVLFVVTISALSVTLGVLLATS